MEKYDFVNFSGVFYEVNLCEASRKCIHGELADFEVSLIPSSEMCCLNCEIGQNINKQNYICVHTIDFTKFQSISHLRFVCSK